MKRKTKINLIGARNQEGGLGKGAAIVRDVRNGKTVRAGAEWVSGRDRRRMQAELRAHKARITVALQAF